jgi:hypothetical protein
MKRAALFIAMSTLVISLGAGSVRADDGQKGTDRDVDQNGKMTGTAVHDPNYLLRLSTSDMARYAAKEAEVQRLAAERSIPGRVTIQSSGYVSTGIWMEPQNEAGSENWCGPGSTTAVVSNWNSKPNAYPGGGQSYMTWLARTGVPGIGPMVVTSGGRPITYDTTLRDTVNNEIGQPFYFVKTGVGGTANFASYLYADLGAYGRPLFTVVQTNGLPGWIGYSVAHYQWVRSFDNGANYISYGDSAGPNATIPYNNVQQNPYGFHGEVPFTTYYSHIADPSVYDEIIY